MEMVLTVNVMFFTVERNKNTAGTFFVTGEKLYAIFMSRKEGVEK